jgi:hypothetical protein
MLFEESEQFTPVLAEQICIRHAANDGVVAVTAHEKEIGGGEDGDADAGVRQAACQRGHLLRRQQRQLGHMADHDPSATIELLRELAHQVDVHGIGGRANVEMDVDVDIELASELENAPDLTCLIAIVARSAPDHGGAAVQAFDQQLIGSGIIGEPFLWKNADLDVDCPLVIGNQRLHAFEAAHANGGIDFDLRAHAGGTVLDAVLQGALGARVHVLDRHALLQW